MPEQRKHLRLPLASTTFIELLSPRVGESESGRMVTCKTTNVSRGGLQVTLSEKLTVGAILQIGVDLPNAANTLYLAGEVRWCLRSNDEHHPWMAGFQILNADDSDIEDWIALIAAMES
jgi:Tfp pilus assembly protein PilZ